MTASRKTRLMFDFPDVADAAEFVRWLKANTSLIPDNVGAYKAQSLDFNARSGGIGRRDTYIMSTADCRDEDDRLTITRIESV